MTIFCFDLWRVDRSLKSLSSLKKKKKRKSACCKSCSLFPRRPVQPGQAPSLTSPDNKKKRGGGLKFLFLSPPEAWCHVTVLMGRETVPSPPHGPPHASYSDPILHKPGLDSGTSLNTPSQECPQSHTGLSLHFPWKLSITPLSNHKHNNY